MDLYVWFSQQLHQRGQGHMYVPPYLHRESQSICFRTPCRAFFFVPESRGRKERERERERFASPHVPLGLCLNTFFGGDGDRKKKTTDEFTVNSANSNNQKDEEKQSDSYRRPCVSSLSDAKR